MKMTKLLILAVIMSAQAWASSTRQTEADALVSSDKTKTYSLPGASDTLAGIAAAQTLTTKTISGANNTLSQLPVGTQTIQAIVTPYPNGSTTAFTLGTAPPAGVAVQLYLDGMIQVQGSGKDYTISGSTITMVTAPATGQRIYAVYSQY